MEASDIFLELTNKMKEKKTEEDETEGYRVLLLGVDDAGKTTFLYHYKLGVKVECIPTAGFNVETLDILGTKLVVWDIGGQEKIRALWRHYYSNTRGIIYVVDSSNLEYFETAKTELHKIIASEELKGVPLLVIASKQDKGGLSH